MSQAEKVNKVQRDTSEYIAKHKLEKIMADMFNALIHSLYDKPLIFMVITSLIFNRLSTFQVFVRRKILTIMELKSQDTFQRDCQYSNFLNSLKEIC